MTGFARAAEEVQLTPTLLQSGELHPNSSAAWGKAISSFSPYEYTGEVKWEFQGAAGAIRGRVTWPIASPVPIPSTVEFDMYWRHSKVEKKKVFSFFDPARTTRFLHSLCSAVAARALLVEPHRLPPPIANHRYQRFQRLHSAMTLPNVDWVFGLRSNDVQCQRLDATRDSFYLISQSGDFTLYMITENPLDYSSPEDLSRLASIEAAAGLA
jgi:hypothetical protein